MGKKKKFSGQKASEKARREQELADYGRILSLRPSVTHESSKDYKRAREKEIARREMSSDDFSFFLFPHSNLFDLNLVLRRIHNQAAAFFTDKSIKSILDEIRYNLITGDTCLHNEMALIINLL